MDGILGVIKPAGMNSNDVVMNLRRLTGEKKSGHTGTLDPNACGLLPICFGKATKLIEYMESSPKEYRCECTLGLVTDTQDVWGKIIEDNRASISAITAEQTDRALQSFTGELDQYPSKYSAVRVNGRHLYQYARSGEEVEIKPRRVSVYSIKLLSFDAGRGSFLFDISCSKGTYVRSVCHDLGQKLGCGAAMSFLLRTRTSGLCMEEAYTLEQLNSLNPMQISGLMIPPAKAVSHIASAELSREDAAAFLHGMRVRGNGREGELYALFCQGVLLGMAVQNGGYFKPRKVFS